MPLLQELYWNSQKLHDQLFSLEYMMRKLAMQGKQCRKTQDKYFELLDELREINAEMLLHETKTDKNSLLHSEGTTCEYLGIKG